MLLNAYVRKRIKSINSAFCTIKNLLFFIYFLIIRYLWYVITWSLCHFNMYSPFIQIHISILSVMFIASALEKFFLFSF